MKLNEYIVFLSTSMWAGAFLQLVEAGEQSAGKPAGGSGGSRDDSEDPDLAKYRELFIERRSQHMPALQSLFESYDYEKQHKMVIMLLEKMEEMLVQSRLFLNEQQFQIGDKFPTDQTMKDTMSLILENVAFVCDIVLRLPDITNKILKKKKEWNSILKWAFEFAQSTGYYDNSHQTLLHLASQQLNFIKRDENFVNPYSKLNQQDMFDMPSKPKKKEKKQKKRGPRISKSEL
nr:coiled-coil domain-containing protein 134-like [Lytechinus pictus]XP_054775336.1 coiled-coil domain-containing protein 134-like [Lytechinus pictus]